jgi:hypothetical protein
MLVCDGISESNFPNAEVVSFAAQRLKEKLDPAAAAAAVCRKALAAGSKDNLSCMIVLLSGKPLEGKASEFIPGPFGDPADKNFRKTYEDFAEHAGVTLAQAVQQRYDDISAAGSAEDEERELDLYRGGPPKELALGSEERLQWFSNWLDSADANSGNGSPFRLDSPGRILQSAGYNDNESDATSVRVLTSLEDLKREVEKAREDGSFKCVVDDETLELVCGKEGTLQKNTRDGTPCIRFESEIGEVFLPSSCFHELTKV